MGIDAIVALVSLFVPPAFDFIKKKFLKPSADTPEATMATLATTKPEMMGAYLAGQAGLLEAKAKYFNRDICGVPSQIIIDLRAAIRPAGVVISFLILVFLTVGWATTDPALEASVIGVRLACISIIGSWFGDRLSDDSN